MSSLSYHHAAFHTHLQPGAQSPVPFVLLGSVPLDIGPPIGQEVHHGLVGETGGNL